LNTITEQDEFNGKLFFYINRHHFNSLYIATMVTRVALREKQMSIHYIYTCIHNKTTSLTTQC